MSEWPKRIEIPRPGGEQLLREMDMGVEVVPADLARELYEEAKSLAAMVEWSAEPQLPAIERYEREIG